MLIDKLLQDFRRRSSSAWAKKSTRQLENLIGFAQLLVLALNLLQALHLGCGDATPHPGINLIALDPFIQGLWHTANLGGDGFDGGPKGWVFASMLTHHPNSAFANLG